MFPGNLGEVGDRTMVTLSSSYHGGLTPGVMADQRKTLADTTELTDTVDFIHSSENITRLKIRPDKLQTTQNAAW